MNTLFGFYWEVWKFIKTTRRDEHWIIEITDTLIEGINPIWKPDREKLETLDLAYNRQVKSEDDLTIITVFIEAVKTDLGAGKGLKTKAVANLLAEISAPTHLDTVLP
jgi:hypothetical protein